MAGEYRDMLGDGNFYLEIQDHGINDQKKVNEGLLKIAGDLNIPLVATDDCHYIERSDSVAHDVLLCIQTGRTINEASRMKFPTDNFYFRSTEEMKKLFSSVPEAIMNTVDIDEKCNLELTFGERFVPTFHIPDSKTADEYLEELCQQGFEARFGRGNKEAVDRLKHELSVIEEMGYASYFLIVWDVIRNAREKGLTVGPGRGSAAGSLAAYVLGVT